MSTKTEVAVKEAANIAVYNSMAEDAGEGFEEASNSSYAIPYISILQSGSPQCKKSEGAYIKGAEEGMFFNSVSGEVLDGEKGLRVVPFHFAHRFIAWGLREKGGGFKGEYMPSDPIVGNTAQDDKGRDVIKNPDGTLTDSQLVDTRIHYVLLETSNGWQPAVLSLSSTQVKKSKQWMSRMHAIRIPNADGELVQAPMASQIWQLTTIAESNDKGSWFGLKVGAAEQLTDMSVYSQAKLVGSQVRSGAVKAQFQDPNGDSNSESGSSF